MTKQIHTTEDHRKCPHCERVTRMRVLRNGLRRCVVCKHIVSLTPVIKEDREWVKRKEHAALLELATQVESLDTEFLHQHPELRKALEDAFDALGVPMLENLKKRG